MEEYDSAVDTAKHIKRVREFIGYMTSGLETAANVHDQSKLRPPEKEAFDIATPKLKGLTYGSPEYMAALKDLGLALDHHYKNNRHHPEHYVVDGIWGIWGMDLVDLTEMICDWLAASERHEDGDIIASIEANQKRFGYSDDLKQILMNTVRNLKDYDRRLAYLV